MSGPMEESTLGSGARVNSMEEVSISILRVRRSMVSGNMVKESDGLQTEYRLRKTFIFIALFKLFSIILLITKFIIIKL